MFFQKKCKSIYKNKFPRINVCDEKDFKLCRTEQQSKSASVIKFIHFEISVVRNLQLAQFGVSFS